MRKNETHSQRVATATHDQLRTEVDDNEPLIYPSIVTELPDRTDYTDASYIAIEDGYYPDETHHFVSLAGIDPEPRYAATITARVKLARRGLMYNSVSFEEPNLHVVRVGWIDRNQPGMGVQHR